VGDRGKAIIVVGAQYGSEGKGAVADALALLCEEQQPGRLRWAVRTGGINAGHSVVRLRTGRKHRMQQLPATWANSPQVGLVVGAGALVHPPTLVREVKALAAAGMFEDRKASDCLKIDYRARPHLEVHTGRSAADGGVVIGATGEGVSHALIDRVRDRKNVKLDLRGHLPEELVECLCDTEELLNDTIDQGCDVLLEGTQGAMLDISLGEYPYVTHKQTGPAQWMMEAGLSPALTTDIWAVVRTYPIRVAGMSGRLDGELEWPDLLRARAAQYRHYYRTPDPNLPEPDTVDLFEGMLAEVDAERPESAGDVAEAVRLRHRTARALQRSFEALNRRDAQDEAALLAAAVERTTITELPRRIATMSMDAVRRSLRQIRPHHVALTFMDYRFPLAAGLNASNMISGTGSDAVREAQEFIAEFENTSGCAVGLATWGPWPTDRHWRQT